MLQDAACGLKAQLFIQRQAIRRRHQPQFACTAKGNDPLHQRTPQTAPPHGGIDDNHVHRRHCAKAGTQRRAHNLTVRNRHNAL